MSRRRHERRAAKAHRHQLTRPVEPAWPTKPPTAATHSPVVVGEALHVKRLAYTRSQAAQALGVSRSTFVRRVLPYVETLEMPSGAKLIPVDELERLVAERRRPVSTARRPSAPRGRRPALAPALVARIRDEHARGASLGQIARRLNADGIETAHGGRQWWPSTVRAALVRSARFESVEAAVSAACDRPVVRAAGPR